MAGLKVYALTSRPLPAGLPEEVTSAASPAELLALMRSGDFTGDVHLVGGSPHDPGLPRD